MSLTDRALEERYGVQKYPPLRPDHPAVGERCPFCLHQFVPGDETTLIPKERPPAGTAANVESVLVHWRHIRDHHERLQKETPSPE